MRESPSRARRWTTVVALTLLLVGLWFWPRHRKLAPATPPEPEPVAPVSAPAAPTVAVSPIPAPAAKPDRRRPKVELRPLVASVDLDKTKACPGEDVRVTARKLADVSNPVQFSIPGRADGSPAIVSFDEPGMRTINVVASDGVGGLDYRSVELEVLSPQAPECAVAPTLAVSVTLSRTDDDAADVRVVSVNRLSGALRYTYDFGDGTTATSSRPYASHSYQLRSQEEPTSSFVVTVRAEDANGKVATARGSIAFRNTYFLSSIVGSPMIPVRYDRFPKRRGSSYETEVTFKNIEKRPIDLASAWVSVDSCTAKGNSEPRQLPAANVLGGLTRLEPDAVETTTLTLPEDLVEGGCRVVVTLEGDTVPPRAGTRLGGGVDRTFDPTRAQLALETAPPPREGALPAAAAVAVTGDETISKLEMASSILGDRPVTPDDIKRLQAEGRLK